MKLTIAFLLLMALQINANISYSQSNEISLTLNNITIEAAINIIEKESDYSFIYSDNYLNIDRTVNINIKNGKITDVLKQLLKNTDIEYNIIDNQIILSKIQPGITQQSTKKHVTGKVTDHTGETIIGVNVMEKGTSNGTVTNTDGYFSIEVSSASVLQFSFIGYNTQEVAVGNKNEINIVLEEDLKMLDEVVVVGYGTKKRLNLAGSVASINAAEITKTPVASVSNALVGRMPGLITLQSSGLPGADQTTLKIRGFDGPLILIDGAEGDLNSIDASEIESVSILKDASAAIYGARAGNGVVLITTKRGESSRPKLTFNSSFSWQGITAMPKKQSAGQYAEITREGHIQSGLSEDTAPFTEEEVRRFYEGTDPQYPNTDWYDLLIRDWSPQQQHNISVRGGGEKVRYYGFLGYMNQETFFKKSDASYSRYNLRANIDAQITSRLSARMDFSTTISTRKYPTRAMDANAWGDFWNTLPIYPAEFPDPTKIPFAEGGGTGGAHITMNRDLSGYSDTQSQDIRFIFDLMYDFHFLPGLKAKGLLDYKQNYTSKKSFSKPVPFYKYDYNADIYTYAGSFGSTANLIYERPRGRQILTQFSLMYDKIINNNHNISALALFEAIDYFNDNVMASRSNFLTPAIDEMLAGSTEGMTNTANTSEMGRMSYVGRLNYSYKDRYILEATLRADASAKFPPSSRWGYFPSASLAWRIDQEDFFKSADLLDALKVRVSYGASGNDNVGNFQYIAGYSITDKETGGSYLFGDNKVPGIISKGIANPNLTWEKLKIYNVGTDITLWKGLLSGAIDIFYRERTGIPANRLITVPSTFGASLPQENINSVSTRGFELTLSTFGNHAGLLWDVKANISWARSKWIHYEEPEYTDIDQRRLNKKSGQWTDRTFGYLSDGLFTSQDEIDNLPYDQDQRENATLRPGDVKYIDVNKDGIIDWKDQVEIGKGNYPTWIVGLNPSFNYKNFDLDLLFQGALGFDVFASLNANSDTYFKKRWTYENNNRNAIVPRIGGASSNGWTSDYRLVNGNYLRLKNINIGYTIKNDILNAIDIESLRLFLSGTNLFTLSKLNKYSLDPEAPSGRGTIYYPQQRNISIGLTLIF